MKLTPEDYANIDAAWDEYVKQHPRKQRSTRPSVGGVREHFYRAGFKAGVEHVATFAEDGWLTVREQDVLVKLIRSLTTGQEG